MAYSFQGLDPVLRLKSRLKIPLSAGVSNFHPALRIAGIVSGAGPTLDYAVELPTEVYEDRGPPTILMIGCGGTGSHLLPNILMYIGSKQKAGHSAAPHTIIVDGDTVEEKNLVRQRFSFADLGVNKAEALAARYSAVFGVKITSVNKYITTKFDIQDILLNHAKSPGPVIIVGAVDNHRARAAIYDYYLGVTGRVFWVDAGNEAWHGQVILGARNIRDKPGTRPWTEANIGEEINSVDLPCFFDVYPKEFLAIGGVPETPQNQCAAITAEDPQTIHANMLSAQCASNLVTQILEGTIRTMSLSFDAMTGNVKATVLTRQNLAKGIAAMLDSRKEIRNFISSLCGLGQASFERDFFPGIYNTCPAVRNAYHISKQ